MKVKGIVNVEDIGWVSTKAHDGFLYEQLVRADERLSEI